TFEGNQHVFGCRLPKGDQRLIFRRSIPRVQGGHIRKLNDHDALRLPYGVILFQDYMAAGLGDVAPAVLRDDVADLGPVLLELCWISNRVLSNDVSWHSSLRAWPEPLHNNLQASCPAGQASAPSAINHPSHGAAMRFHSRTPANVSDASWSA